MQIEEEEISAVISHYMPPRKPNAKPIKEPKDGKLDVFTVLLHEEVLFEGEVLGRIPQLKMEYLDFNDRIKYPQFEPSRYLKQVRYPNSGVTRLEPF